MKRVLLSTLLIAVLNSGCGNNSDPSVDSAAEVPTITSRTTEILPPYGHGQIGNACRALKDIPKPWTVEKMRKLYLEEKKDERRAHLLWILACSRDPRAAMILGDELTNQNAKVRTAAAGAIFDFFVEQRIDGGTEQVIQASESWWKDNRDRLEVEIQKLRMNLTEQGAEGDAVNRAP